MGSSSKPKKIITAGPLKHLDWIFIFVSISLNLYFIIKSDLYVGPRIHTFSALSRTSHSPPPGFSCSADAVSKQAEFLKLALEKDELKGCVEPINFIPYLKAIWRSNSEKLILLNVGANKGYEVAEWLAVMLPQLGISPQKWGQEYLRGKYPDVFDQNEMCGLCRRCERKISIIHNSTLPWEEKDVRIIAAEAMPSNFKILQELKTFSNFSGLVLLPCAIGESSGAAFISDSHPGDERQQVEESKAYESSSNLNLTSVDEISAVFKLGRIHWLRIDTQGFDPKVLRGAKNKLEANSVSVLEFSYNAFWPEADSLRDAVEYLDILGYDCYLKTREKLLRITGCFDPVFEFRRPGGVICASRREKEISAFFVSRSFLEFV